MRLVPAALAALLCAFTAAAQAPLPPKRIPPPGYTLTDAERTALTAGAAALRDEINAIVRDFSGDARRTGLLPDVEIFHKAVDWALRYDEFMAPKEVAYARMLLEQGRRRVADLRAGRAPWLEQKGLVLRGHRSRLDGSVQPYGLVVPEDLAPPPAQPPLLVWLLGYIAAGWYFVPKLSKLSEAQADMRSLVTGRVVDSYTNIPTVKLFAHADREDAYAKEGMEAMLSAVYRSMRMATLLTATLQVLSGLLIFGMGAMSVWLWHQGSLSTGAIAFAVGLTLRMQGMSQWIIWEIATLFEDVGVVQDGIETIARERAIKDAAAATPLAVSAGAIRFDAVSFNYGKPVLAGQRPVLDQLTLDIAPGEKVGLVGRSGAGKSTLTNLLLRFYDIEHGRILIDGRDIAEVTQDSLRAAIGVVTQDTSLLHRSVLENIRYGKPEATMVEVDSAARKAHADEFVAALVDPSGRRGFDAHVGERGVKLSGGQRQRVAIARVLLKNAPILVLDEATSALDSEVEQAIQENLYALMEGKTVIAVAHRLSTIAAMDRLVIMDKGVIVEQGTHRELLDRGGLYATLWQRQSGGFLLEPEETPSARQGTNQ